MQTIADDWEVKLRQKKLELKMEVPDNLPGVMADRLRIEQVLNNLLENAVKYTEPEGKITLRATNDAAAVTLRVEDTGPGRFRRRICRTSSSGSTAPINPAIASRAAPASAFQSSSISSICTAGRHPPRAIREGHRDHPAPAGD